MRRNQRWVPILLLLILLPLAPMSSASGGRPVSAEGPDGDGAYQLTFEVVRPVDGTAAVSLDVRRTDLDGTVTATHDLGTHAFATGASLFSTTYLPTLGAGFYEVALVVQTHAGDPLTFNVTQGDGTSARVTYTIPDEPTVLELTSDSVNSDGKLKSPGDTLVTRATLRDGNGWGDLDRVDMRIDRGVNETWAWFEERTLDISAPANATEIPLEVEFTRAPMPSGNYRLSIVAIKNDSAVAQTQRTFVIREILPRLEAPALEDVSPDGRTVSADIVVTDRNGFTEDRIEARAYRGSSRVEESGFAADLAGAGPEARIVDIATLSTSADSARAAIPVNITVPFGADPGTYRISLYVNGTLVGSLPFNVLELPDWVSVTFDETDDSLTVDVVATGEGIVKLSAGTESMRRETTAHLVEGRAVLTLDRPGADASVPWNLSLHTSDDGPAVAERSGLWNRSTSTVPLTVKAAHVSPRLPATWTVAGGEDWSLDGATVNITILRWDGTAASPLSARYQAGRVRVDGPANVEPGRYQVQLSVTLPNGSQGTTSWHFEAGPWIRLESSQAEVAGREARIEVTNAGGVSVDRFIVELDGAPTDSTLAWQTADGERGLTRRGPRHHADGVALAPGDAGVLVVRLPDGPLPAGALEIRVRLLALRS